MSFLVSETYKKDFGDNFAVPIQRLWFPTSPDTIGYAKLKAITESFMTDSNKDVFLTNPLIKIMNN